MFDVIRGMLSRIISYLISLHKQVSGWTVNFCPNFPERAPFWNFRPESTPPPSPILENFRFEMTKVYSEIPPPPVLENFRFEMTKVYSKIPPILENFRFEMTKVYSKIPPLRKTSDFRWSKFTPKYPPISENAGHRMWRLICNPQGYHSLVSCYMYLSVKKSRAWQSYTIYKLTCESESKRCKLKIVVNQLLNSPCETGLHFFEKIIQGINLNCCVLIIFENLNSHYFDCLLFF